MARSGRRFQSPRLGVRRLVPLATLLLGLFIAPTAHATDSRFVLLPLVTTSFGPYDVELADMDSDGDLDVLETAYDANMLRVRFNDGLGALSAPADYPCGWILSVKSGKLNDDAYPDVAGAQFADGVVSVWLGQGGGVLGAPTQYAMGSLTRDVVLADLDGDEALDLVATSAGDGTIRYRINSGTGTFGPVQSLLAGAQARAVTAGDWNGDDKVDLAVACYQANTLVIFTNLGGLQFSSQPSATAFGPTELVSGDLDGDGDLDLAVSTEGQVAQVFRNSSGAFSVASSVPIPSLAQSIDAGDFNEDGKLDLLISSYTAAQAIAFKNLGNLAFGKMASAQLNGSPRDAAAGDLDGDGRADFVAGLYLPFTSALRVGITLPAIKFCTWSGLETANLASQTIAVDIDGDSDLDLATVGETEEVRIRRNVGFGEFVPAGTYFVPGAFAQSIAAADFDRDGDQDLVCASFSASAVRVLRNTGSGFTVEPSIAVGPNPRFVIALDLDNDQWPEIATANYFDAIGEGSVSILHNLDGAGFQAKPDIAVEVGPYMLTAGDWNGDQRMDLAVCAYDANQVSVLLQVQDLQFDRRPPVDVEWGLWCAVGDYDKDGDPDFAVSNFQNSSISIVFNDGAGNFGGRRDIIVGDRPRSLASGDVDSDGDIDIVVALYGDESLVVVRNEGLDGFEVQPGCALVGGPKSVLLADFDQNGILKAASALPDDDLVVVGHVSSIVPAVRAGGPRSITTLPTEGVTLEQSVPNPARGEVSIGFVLPRDAVVRLTIVDVGGRVVHREERSFAAGQNQARWNGRTTRGSEVSPGIYFYRLETGDVRLEKRLLYLGSGR